MNLIKIGSCGLVALGTVFGSQVINGQVDVNLQVGEVTLEILHHRQPGTAMAVNVAFTPDRQAVYFGESRDNGTALTISILHPKTAI